MKGLILAGGNGTRLYPITKAISKQLLPVFDKPMIYFPLSTLMLAGIREIAVVSSPGQIGLLQNLLGDGRSLGISLEYIVQKQPLGIPDVYKVAGSFVGDTPSALVLGDNLFFGGNLGKALGARPTDMSGAHVFAAKVSDPQNYGVLEISDSGSLVGIEEKPAIPRGNLAIPGLYFFDGTVKARVQTLKASERGELEIVDLLKSFLEDKGLTYSLLPRGSVWLDMGTPEGLSEAGDFVRILQRRQKVLVSAVEEVALNMGFISLDEFEVLLDSMPAGEYKTSLSELVN